MFVNRVVSRFIAVPQASISTFRRWKQKMKKHRRQKLKEKLKDLLDKKIS